MTSRKRWLPLVVPVLLVLGACSTPAGADETVSTAGGAIELAVSKTCTGASDPQCISVNGENVARPTAFERADVEDAAVADGGGQSAVGVTFTHDGAEVFHSLTKQAAQAGRTARLVVKIGGEIRAAVAVMQALEGDRVQIALSPDDSASKVVNLIRQG